jgi:hypothetical protein
LALRVLPSVERLVVEYLRASTDVQALVNQRVSTSLPSSPTFPYVTLLLVSGGELARNHLDVVTLQVDAWGGTREQADVLIRTVRAAMLQMPGVHDGAVVSAVVTLVTPRWNPDDTVEPPKARYTCDMQVVLHPA